MWRIEHPEYLIFVLALLPLPWLFARYLKWRTAARAALGSNKAVLRTFPPSHQSNWRAFALLTTCIALFSLAAIDLRFGRGLSETKSNQTDVMIALDISTSMLAEDTRPNRISYAKRFLAQWVQQSAPQTRIGLMAFAGTTQVETPPYARSRICAQQTSCFRA